MKKILGFIAILAVLAFSVVSNAQLVNVDRTGRTQWYLDDAALWFGNLPDDSLLHNSRQDVGSLQLGLSATSNTFLISEYADLNSDFNLTVQTNPTLRIQSEDATTPLEYISISHDGVNGVIDVGTGAVSIPDGIIAPITATSPFTVVEDDAGAIGAINILFHDSASPASGDIVGRVNALSTDDAGNETHYVQVDAMIFNPADGAEVGAYAIYLASGTGGALPAEPQFSINGASGTVDIAQISDGDEGAGLGFFHSSASPAAYDIIGFITAEAMNDAAGEADYGSLGFAILDPADGAEVGGFSVGLADGSGAIPDVGQFTVNGDSGAIAVNRTDAGATGSAVVLNHISASPAVSDEIGLIKFTGLDDGAGVVEYATIKGIIDSPTDAAEIGHLAFYSQNGTGAFPLSASIGHNGSYGFIALGDGAAAGLVKSSGDFDLIIETGNAVSSSMTITDGADGNITLDVNGAGVFTDGTFSVDDGAFTGVASIVATGDITSSDAGDIGWSIVAGANTACSTTCTFACVAGQDADAANVLVDCANAAADLCICAGAN